MSSVAGPASPSYGHETCEQIFLANVMDGIDNEHYDTMDNDTEVVKYEQ